MVTVLWVNLRVALAGAHVYIHATAVVTLLPFLCATLGLTWHSLPGGFVAFLIGCALLYAGASLAGPMLRGNKARASPPRYH